MPDSAQTGAHPFDLMDAAELIDTLARMTSARISQHEHAARRRFVELGVPGWLGRVIARRAELGIADAEGEEADDDAAPPRTGARQSRYSAADRALNAIAANRADTGPAFDQGVLAELHAMRIEDPGKYEDYRATFKSHGVRVPALEQAMNRWASRGRSTQGPREDENSGTANWPGMCQQNQRGEMLGNLHNAMVVLRHEPDHMNILGFNEMTSSAVIKAGTTWQALTDAHVSALQEKLQRLGLKSIGSDVMHQAVALRADERRFHPVRDYLQALRWDGVGRLDTWLATYCNAGDADAEYLNVVGRCFLIAMVARVMRPGCKVDHVMILEGEQGIRKSTVARILGGDWFSDSMPPISAGKDAMQHLRGKWLIELGELAAMRRAEAGHLKQFLTVTTDKYRPSYGRNEVEYPRQCVFIGTTNEMRYLQDATGARRFWPVRVLGECDTDALVRDRDQLFAEAFDAFRKGEVWWPKGGFEREYARAEQEDRHTADEWQDEVARFLIDKRTIAIRDVLIDGLKMPLDRIDELPTKRVAAILRRLGWVLRRKTHVRWWEPGPHWQSVRDQYQAEATEREATRHYQAGRLPIGACGNADEDIPF